MISGMRLKVWWIPQVTMKPFEVPVSTVEEGALLLDTLGKYDQFLLDTNVRPDYSNVGGLAQWNDEVQDWEDWEDEETGADDPIEFCSV